MNYEMLINKTNKITQKKSDNISFSKVKDIEGKEILVEKETLKAYRALKKEMRSRGLMIGIISAYRSLKEQRKTIADLLEKYDEEYVRKIAAPVGASEHHTGLAIDISIHRNKKFIAENEDLYANEDVYKRIHCVLPEFGFILRYPEGKTEITGYNYEPWHIRYVGIKLARIIFDEGIVLEEYYENTIE